MLLTMLGNPNNLESRVTLRALLLGMGLSLLHGLFDSLTSSPQITPATHGTLSKPT